MAKKISKKRLLYYTLAFLLISFIIYVTPGVKEYLLWTKSVKAVGGCPWQEGGVITKYTPLCILDTPASSPVTCAISCPMATSVWGTACTAYTEIMVVGQLGTPFITPPIGFPYMGSGVPTSGMQFLSCGSANSQPWLMALPGPVAWKIHQTVDWIKIKIASFRE